MQYKICKIKNILNRFRIYGGGGGHANANAMENHIRAKIINLF